MTSDAIFDLLKPERLTSVVDVGASPLDGAPPYTAMLAKRLCRVTGFEPNDAARAHLDAGKSDLETYRRDALGDGAEATLYICNASGMTSLFEPNPETLMLFSHFPEQGAVEHRLRIQTRRLDDISEIDGMDFLKMDIQGGELSVLQNGRKKLARTVAVQTEVSFVPLYKGQPCFGEIDVELRKQGMIPHTVVESKEKLIKPMINPNDEFASIKQIIEMDVVYVRDFSRPDLMDAEQLKQLALIAHHCYRSYDLALNCMFHLAKRQVIPTEGVNWYLKMAERSLESDAKTASNLRQPVTLPEIRK